MNSGNSYLEKTFLVHIRYFFAFHTKQNPAALITINKKNRYRSDSQKDSDWGMLDDSDSNRE